MSDQTKTAGLSPVKQAFLALEEAQTKIRQLERQRREPIAIIGMACRFPGGANDPDAYWQLLRNGVEAIQEVPAERWDVDAYYDPDPETPGKMVSRYGGFLAGIDQFDAEFFGISPREANRMDPQHRLLLEVCWEALDHAGQTRQRLAGSQTGVFVGITLNDYQWALPFHDLTQVDVYDVTGNAHNTAAGRISYLLGFHGPCMAIDTACSSSLVAIHQACMSLRNQECERALAGSVNLILNPFGSIALSRGRVLSPDGHSKTFDAAADGMTRSEGCGVIVLKRLSDAQRDGDTILALIRGSAINQDGPSSGLTVPNGPAQEAVLRQALHNAGLEPQQVSYVEAHGTGTPLGDPIELHALGAVLGKGRSHDQPLWVGSVKTNIGHLEASSGIAGLIKVVLSLQHGEIPAHLHFNQPNPLVDWARYPLRVTTEHTPWVTQQTTRCAGVSSFGFSGTNAHILLEEAPPPKTQPVTTAQPFYPFTFSAPTEAGTYRLATCYENYLRAHPELPLPNVAWTVNHGRAHLAQRVCIVAASTADLCNKLADYRNGVENPAIIQPKSKGNEPPSSVPTALYQLAQRYVQGEELEWAAGTGEEKIQKVLLPVTPFQRQRYWVETTSQAIFASGSQVALQPPARHPLLGAPVRLAGSQELRFEVQLSPNSPPFLGDHRLFQEVVLPATAYFEMALAAGASAWQTKALQVADVVLQQALILPQKGSQRVQIVLSPAEGGRYTCQIYSMDWRDGGQSADWTLHATGKLEPLNSADGRSPAPLATLRREISEPVAIDHYYQRCLALGIDFGPTFRTLRQVFQPASSAGADGVLSLSHVCLPPEAVKDGQHFVLHPALLDGCFHGLGAIFAARQQDDSFLPIAVDRLQSYRPAGGEVWCHAQVRSQTSAAQLVVADLQLYSPTGELLATVTGLQLKRATQKTLLRPSLAKWQEWLYTVEWRPQPLTEPPAQVRGAQHWLILADRTGLAEQLQQKLAAQGDSCTLAFPGAIYANAHPSTATLNPSQPADFQRLLADVIKHFPGRLGGVIYLWGHIWGNEHLWLEDAYDDVALLDSVLPMEAHRGCATVLWLTQALLKANLPTLPTLWLVTQRTQMFDAAAALVKLAQSPLRGLSRTIGLEHPELICKCVDLDVDSPSTAANVLYAELQQPSEDDHIAYQQQARLVARLGRFQPLPAQEILIKQEATYLISGGLGGLGLHFAHHLVQRGARSLVLLGRNGADVAAQQAIAQMQQLGAQIKVAAVDVADWSQISTLFAEISATLPPLRGLIHAAGVLRDGVILQQEWSHYAAVFAPKLMGSWNLHRLTERLELDFFVLFSSTAALWGSPGQANYAAANAFLDGLARYRQGRRLPALSINWGAWSQVGLAARQPQMEQRLAAVGLGSLTPAQGAAIFDSLLSQNAPQVVATPLTWPTFLRQFPGAALAPFYREFAGQMQERKVALPPASATADQLQQVMAAPPEGRSTLVMTFLRGQVTQVLKLNGDQLDPERSFSHLGMDSLMAIELRNRVKRGLGVDLPLVTIMSDPTLASLTQEIGVLLPPPATNGAKWLPLDRQNHHGQQPEPVADATQLLANLDQMSDAEMDALLATLAIG